jgi:hypothetical protein
MKFVSPATNAIPVLAVDDHAMFREAGWHCYTTPPSPSMAEVEIRKMRMVGKTASTHAECRTPGCVANRMRGSGLPSGGHPFSQICQAAMPNIRSMKRFWPTTSPFANQRI